MKWFAKAAAVVAIALISGAIGASFQLVNIQWQSDFDVSYSEFISVILTALAVMLTALGLMIGALGIIGWTAFRSHVSKSAEDYLKGEFKEEGERFRSMVEELKQAAIRRMFEGVQAEELEEPLDKKLTAKDDQKGK